MKVLFRSVVLMLFAGSVLSSAQGTPPAPSLPASSEEDYYTALFEKMLPFLTPEERTKFESVLYPTLDKHPELVKDGHALVQEGTKPVDQITFAEGQAYLKKMNAYKVRLRTAMAAQDPSVNAIFDKIDANRPQ